MPTHCTHFYLFIYLWQNLLKSTGILFKKKSNVLDKLRFFFLFSFKLTWENTDICTIKI